MKQHSDAVAREAQILRADGASYSEIANILGLPNAKSSVQQLLKRVLPPPPPPPPEPPSFVRPDRLPPINRGCQWTDSTAAPWTWCGKPVDAPGSPWCAEHVKRVYAGRGRVREGA
jgi:hypothetical protein